MLPEQELSTSTIFASTEISNPQPDKLTSRELGGVALNNPNDGLMVKVWTATVIPGDPNDTVMVGADDVPAVAVVSAPEITEVSLAFDQNMQPTVAFVSSSAAKLYWYDSAIPGYTVTDYGLSVTTPRITLDDHRERETGTSDIILAYIRDGSLFFRAQRDRFLIEYMLYPDIAAEIVNPQLWYICMNNQLRLQFEVRGYFYGG